MEIESVKSAHRDTFQTETPLEQFFLSIKKYLKEIRWTKSWHPSSCLRDHLYSCEIHSKEQTSRDDESEMEYFTFLVPANEIMLHYK